MSDLTRVVAHGRPCDFCGELFIPEERVKFGRFAYDSPECEYLHGIWLKKLEEQAMSDPEGSAGFEFGEEVGPR